MWKTLKVQVLDCCNCCMGSNFIIQQLVGTHTKHETQGAFDSVLFNSSQGTVMDWGTLIWWHWYSQHHNARNCTRKENKQGKVLEEINKGVRHAYSHLHFFIFIETVIQKWQQNLDQNTLKPTQQLNTVLLAVSQVILAKIEDNLWTAVYRLIKTIKEHNRFMKHIFLNPYTL
jgi:hypothetical protein